MPTLSSLLETGLFPLSPIAEWPPPPLMDCPEATSLISLHHRLHDWLPSRIVYDANLALTFDANLREAVALAEAAAVLAGRDTDIVNDTTAETVKDFLRSASEKLPSYHENRIQQRLDQVIEAVLPLVRPLHTLFGLPAPPELAVDGPAHLPAVPVKPDADAGDDLFARQLHLKRTSSSTPEAQRPPGPGDTGGIHHRLQAALEGFPDFTIGQIELDISDEDVRSELLKQVVRARICGNEHLIFADGIKFAVGRLVSEPDNGYSAIISPFHPVVPSPSDSCTPSFARVILATLCPFVIKADQANRALLAESRQPVVTDQATDAARRQQSPSDGRSVPGDAGSSSLSGSSPREAPTVFRGVLSSVSTFRIIYPDRHAVDAWRFDPSPDADAADAADSDRPTFRLFWLITKGGGGVVYGGRDPWGDQIVLKVALPEVEWALQDEYKIGEHLRDFAADAEAPYLLLKTSKPRLMAVSRYAGESPEEWDDLSRDIRIALFTSLVRLHQLAHVQHNDIAPRNVVVDADDATSARWIDWSLAKLGHDCGGSGCYELRSAAGEMGLYDEGGLAEDVQARLATEGLRW
ncbi:Non-specific serine/threonine protein kinase [Rhodotorula toruloides]|nr:Non-specific serine/threonine protein kinase [Rhodotorula toruloides]